MLFGGYEGSPPPAGLTACRGSTVTLAPPDHERFEPLMRGAIRRFPFLEGAEVVALVCHPDAMTPMPPSARPASRHPWAACRRGSVPERVLEGRHRQGDRRVGDGWGGARLTAYRAWRFGHVHRDPLFAAEQARRRIATTTSSGTRSIRTNGDGRNGSPRCIRDCRSWAASSVRNTAGNDLTTFGRRAGGARGQDQRAFGWACDRRGSRGSAKSTRRS